MRRLSTRTPIGVLELEVDEGRLTELRFVEASDAPEAPDDPVVEAVDRYFAGELDALDHIDVEFRSGTPFQREVWSALRTIPCGRTISYAELARKVGRDMAFRAVGAANGQNPVAVVVPCHRVIASGGALGGYGGGLERKRWLLEHEGVDVGAPSLPGLG